MSNIIGIKSDVPYTYDFLKSLEAGFNNIAHFY